MNNPVCKALGISYPVIQGPMAWIATASLVAAVSEAGGLGVLGVGFAPLEFVKNQIYETKKLTSKPFAINIFMVPGLGTIDQITQIAIETQTPVIYADTLSGMEIKFTKKYVDIWHQYGIKVVIKASHMADALVADAAGADVVIVKGWEGGGHVTFESTMVLMPQAADKIKAPLVASGGIADGRGLAAAVMLGASGIEMGTIFMAAKEANIHPNVKQAVIDAEDMSTVITGNTTGEACRQLANKLSECILDIEAKYPKIEAAEKLKTVAESSLKKAMIEGDVENEGAVMAGQIVALVDEIRPVKDIISSIIKEGQKLLGNPPNIGI